MSENKIKKREFTFSIVTIGESAVGKTSLIKSFSDPGPKQMKHIATIGLDNVVIVDADDSLLIARMDKIQDVKKVAEEMKKRG